MDEPRVGAPRRISDDAVEAVIVKTLETTPPGLLRPNWNALLPTADALPRTLRDALDHLDTEIRKLHEEATLAAA